MSDTPSLLLLHAATSAVFVLAKVPYQRTLSAAVTLAAIFHLLSIILLVNVVQVCQAGSAPKAQIVVFGMLLSLSIILVYATVRAWDEGPHLSLVETQDAPLEPGN